MEANLDSVGTIYTEKKKYLPEGADANVLEADEDVEVDGNHWQPQHPPPPPAATASSSVSDSSTGALSKLLVLHRLSRVHVWAQGLLPCPTPVIVTRLQTICSGSKRPSPCGIAIIAPNLEAQYLIPPWRFSWTNSRMRVSHS